MAIALMISLGYSLNLRKKVNEIAAKESVIISRSIVQLTASNVSIKNVLTIQGNVIKKSEINNIILNSEGSNQNSELNNNIIEENENVDKMEYVIAVNLSTEETLKKVKVGQDIEIKIEKDGKNLKYNGKIIKIEKNEQNNQNVAIIEFNFDENIQENMKVTCTIIVEEAEDVIAVPIAAIKTREKKDLNTIDNKNNVKNEVNENFQNTQMQNDNSSKVEKYVIVVNDDGTTNDVVVETGISDDSYIEIVSGLSEGQKVQIVEE